MKKIITILFVLFFIGCIPRTKDCIEWYSYFGITPVTKTNNGNEWMYDGWYRTDFAEHELNIKVSLYSSADGYEECESTTRIHYIIWDSIYIGCNHYLVINEDTIKRNSNLIEYFYWDKIMNNNIFVYNIEKYDFPVFEQPENTFIIKYLLSDNQNLKDSCVLKIIQ